MCGTLVRSDSYPPPERFDDELVDEYSILSRYAAAAALLESSPVDPDRVEPAPASPDELRYCCSDRRLRRHLGTPPEISPDRPELWAEALAVGGTLEATEAALAGSRAVHLGGGHHHAHRGGSSARTLFNDVVAAVEYAKRCGIDRIAVVDLDVHHHDGTRAVYRLDGDVSLFSMHGWNLFPGTGWLHETGRGHASGNHLNMPLPAGTDGRTYLAVLERLLPPWLRAIEPELVLYVAGADVNAADPIGNLEVPIREIYERDRFVAAHVGDRPLVAVTGGGYGPDAPAIHANTVAAILGAEPVRTSAAADEPATRSDADVRSSALRWLSALVRYYERQYPGVL